MLKRSLLLDEFLALGEDRVRLNDEQRRAAFAVFHKYTAFCRCSVYVLCWYKSTNTDAACRQNQCWDDADRILALIR